MHYLNFKTKVLQNKAPTKWVFVVLMVSVFSCGQAEGIQMDYSPTLDSICSVFSGPGIEDSWKTELDSVLPEFENAWGTLGVQLVSGSEEVIKKKIDLNFTAHLTLCNTPSRSLPVILNMRYALTSFTDSPVPLRVKVGTLHHEILHREVDDLVPDASQLMAEYADEHKRVRGHLHLLAVQKATYLKLGLKDELAEVIDIDSQLPNGYYQRAWEIVNAEPQRYQQFLAELGIRAGLSRQTL